MSLAPREAARKRAEAQSLPVQVQVGKLGITDATVAELDRHLRQHRLVKVRLLRSARETGIEDQTRALASATRSEVIEVRGHTAVFWRDKR